MSFANMKRSSGNFADLSKKLGEERKGGGGGKDDRYWELKVDDAGNGYAVIRFLPAPDGEEYPFVKLYSHGFKDKRTNKWYIENSRTTLGEPDPVSEANTILWNSGLESDKALARERKRRQSYISNILVVSDPKNPENEGKVFLFKYGVKIFQMIESALEPKFEDEKPFNPFDFWTGANFKLKAFKSDGQRSYEKSGFDTPAALFDGDDAALEKLWKMEYSLQAEIAPDKFKSYDQLKTRFDAVVGATQPAPREQERQETAAERQFSEPTRSEPDSPPWRERRESSAPARQSNDADDLTGRYSHLLDD